MYERHGTLERGNDGAWVGYFLGVALTGVPTVVLKKATGPVATFVAPDLGEEGAALTFELWVKDDAGLKARTRMIVNVASGYSAPASDAVHPRTSCKGLCQRPTGFTRKNPFYSPFLLTCRTAYIFLFCDSK
jgi:hypothetical protein